MRPAPAIALPRLRLRVIEGGRGKGPGRVEAYRHELADREAEGIEAMRAIITALEAAQAHLVRVDVPSVPFLSEMGRATAVASTYRQACRERAALIDPPGSAA